MAVIEVTGLGKTFEYTKKEEGMKAFFEKRDPVFRGE